MMTKDQFNRGDRIVHTKRPEWGDGVVDQAVVIHHEGKSAQQLVVQFANRGRVTVNTAIAPVRSADNTFNQSSQGGWLAALENSGTGGGRTGGGGGAGGTGGAGGETTKLGELPDPYNDPFVSTETRLNTVLDSYRYRDDARGLIDWAVAMTRLNDPLSDFTRHELEEAYRLFAHKRTQCLNEIVRLLKQGQRHILEKTLQGKLEPKAREALKRAIRA